MTKQNKLTLKDLLLEAEKEKDLKKLTKDAPDELYFNNYQTSYFYMCSDARRLFEKLKDVSNKDCVSFITSVVKETDKFFKQEESLQEKITPAKLKTFANAAFKIKYMLGQIQEMAGRELGTGIRFPEGHLELVLDKYVEQLKKEGEVESEGEFNLKTGPGTLPSWMWK